MSRKSKGLNAERDLLRAFWSNGWAAIRVAGSGSSHYPSPDLIVGKEGRRLAIECKITKDDKKYISSIDIQQLNYFSNFSLYCSKNSPILLYAFSSTSS